MGLHLKRGMEPWRPTESSTIVEQYHFHDIPLVGVLEEAGRKYLFECLAGERELYSLWTYVPMADEDVAYLNAADDDGFVDRLREFDERVSQYAAALDEIGIVVWVDVADVPDDTDPVDWLIHAVRDFGNKAKAHSDDLALSPG